MTKLLLNDIFRHTPVTRGEEHDIHVLLYDVLKEWNTTDWQTKVN